MRPVFSVIKVQEAFGVFVDVFCKCKTVVSEFEEKKCENEKQTDSKDFDARDNNKLTVLFLFLDDKNDFSLTLNY